MPQSYEIETAKADVLVLGGGVAGHRAAAAAKRTGASVAHAYHARGASLNIFGFNVPIAHADGRDSREIYFEDVIKGGYGISDRRLVHKLAEGAELALSELVDLGIPFARDGNKFAQNLLSGSTYPRSVYHPMGLGRLALKHLSAHCKEIGVHTYSGWKAIALLLDETEVVGALLIKLNSSTLLAVHAGATVLATGGIGAIYADSTYPADVTADSYAMAYSAGANLIDMEFVEFEPTVVVHPHGCKGLVMPTAMLGNGAPLLNVKDERFMFHHNPEHGEKQIGKARMALCIQREIDEGRGFPDGSVVFDTTKLTSEKLETHKEKCRRLRAVGFEPSLHAPRVRPAAHSHMGGVQIDPSASTGIAGLYAAGEAAGGVHGASRLAGNSATDVFVFGSIAGRAAAAATERLNLAGREWGRIHASAVEPLRKVYKQRADSRPADAKSAIRDVLLTSAGLYRNRDNLVRAADQLDSLQRQIDLGLHVASMREAVRALEASNMALVAKLIVMSALAREESRGGHQRTDFPSTNDGQWLRHVRVRKGAAGYISLDCVPIQ